MGPTIPPKLSHPGPKARRKVGQDIPDARLRRRIPTAIMSQRALVTRTTLHKVERGDPTVAMGTYCTVLFVLGMTERLRGLRGPRFFPPGFGVGKDAIYQVNSMYFVPPHKSVIPASRTFGSNAIFLQ